MSRVGRPSAVRRDGRLERRAVDDDADRAGPLGEPVALDGRLDEVEVARTEDSLHFEPFRLGA